MGEVIVKKYCLTVLDLLICSTWISGVSVSHKGRAVPISLSTRKDGETLHKSSLCVCQSTYSVAYSPQAKLHSHKANLTEWNIPQSSEIVKCYFCEFRFLTLPYEKNNQDERAAVGKALLPVRTHRPHPEKPEKSKKIRATLQERSPRGWMC